MKKINFLPKELRPKFIVNLDYVMILVLVLLVGGIGTSLAMMMLRDKKITDRIMVLSTKIKSDTKKIEDFKSQNLDQQTQEVEEPGQSKILVDVANKRETTNKLLKELSYITPAETWLSTMKLVPGSGDEKKGKKGESTSASINVKKDLFISGFAYSKEAVRKMVGRLENSISYRDVSLEQIEPDTNYTPVIYKFSFRGPVKFPTRETASSKEEEENTEKGKKKKKK